MLYFSFFSHGDPFAGKCAGARSTSQQRVVRNPASVQGQRLETQGVERTPASSGWPGASLEIDRPGLSFHFVIY